MAVFSRDEVVGKIVIDARGNSVGKVADVAISSDGIAILKVAADTGEVIDIPMIKVQAIGEYVILKPETKASTPQTYPPPTTTVTPPPPPSFPSSAPPPPAASGDFIRCPNCGFMNPPGAKFCQNCGAKLAQKGGLLSRLGL